MTNTTSPTTTEPPSATPSFAPTNSPTLNDQSGWSDPSTAYIISGTIAGPLLVFVLYTFCRFKRIRSHPAPLMFARTIADTGFILTILLLSAVVDSDNNNSSSMSSSEAICSTFGPLISFFFLASQFYFIGMCYDLYTTCTYPLRSVSYTSLRVHIYSWLVAAIITIFFSILLPNAYQSIDDGEVCFIGIGRESLLTHKANESKSTYLIELDIQTWIQFLGPYLFGIISGIASLIFVFFRLRNGLGDVFEHATRMVKDHIIFVALYTLLGIAWFILLLTELEQAGLSFSISFIIVGTASIDCTTWILQKFRSSTMRNPLHRTTKLGDFLRKQTDLMNNFDDNSDDVINLSALHEHDAPEEQSMSQALRLELIRNMCSGVTQSLDHFKHNREYNQSQHMQDIDVTALHFPPISCIKSGLKKNSELEKKCILDQSIHRFLMASHSSGGTDQIDFIDFSPHVFRYLRNKIFKTTEDEYAESIHIALNDNNSMNSLSAKFSEGKSGAFFFMTPNNKYMVKTLKKSEAETFLKILPGYFEHMRKFPDSFITHFYGLFGIKLYGTRLYFTIMKNIFIANLEPHEKYDVKGSWINRHTKHHIELGKLMKDEDLKKNILMPHEDSKKSWEQMSHDTRFLNTLNIMDYSLLLGIYYIGISSKDANFDFENKSEKDWKLHTTATSSRSNGGGSYTPPKHSNYHQSVELAVNINNHNKYSMDSNQSENEELKQAELKEGDDDTGNQSLHSSQKHYKDTKSDLVDVDTMHEMKKDFEKNKKILSPRNKLKGSGLRRRAFTANTGLTELANHPMSYQARMIEGPGFYIMGIIDILQEYNFEKKIERIAKVFIKCVDGYGISCIEPSMYRKRFLAKMLQIGIGRKSVQY